MSDIRISTLVPPALAHRADAAAEALTERTGQTTTRSDLVRRGLREVIERIESDEVAAGRRVVMNPGPPGQTDVEAG